MQKKTRSDGTGQGARRTGGPFHAGNANKQIRGKKNAGVKAGELRTVSKQDMVYVGIDLHKTFLQVAAVDERGTLLMNRRVENRPDEIRLLFSAFPRRAKYVIESSSVWRGVYRQMEGMGLDTVLSNPYKTRLIAESVDKTDANDARRLAELLRGGYIHTSYVPPSDVLDARSVVRFRAGYVKRRTSAKNKIHGILLQESTKIEGKPFAGPYVAALRDLKDWRIDSYLGTIAHYNDCLIKADMKIRDIVKRDKAAQLLTTIPGIGDFSAAVVCSEIGDIARFRDPGRLVSNVGLAPSVRRSAGTVHRGKITRMGNSMVRWVLTEAVHSHCRYAEDSPITFRYRRLRKRMPAGKAATACAAKMLSAMFFMIRDGIDYDEFVRRGRDITNKRTARHAANLKSGKRPASRSGGEK